MKLHTAKVQTTDSRHWFHLALFIVAGWFVSVLSPILMPFVAGAMLAYLGTPLVDRLQQAGRSRILGVTLVFLLFSLLTVAALVWLLPLLEKQITNFFRQFPAYMSWLHQAVLPWLKKYMGFEGELQDLDWLQQVFAAHWRETGGVVKGVLVSVSRSGAALLGTIANVVLIPVIAFYLLRDWHYLVDGVRALLPRRYEPTVVRLSLESDRMLAGFLRGQLMVMFGLAIIYIMGLWLVVGLEVALPVGLFAGMVSFVPYLGLILGILLAGMAAVLQFQSFEPLFWVSLVFIGGQVIEGVLLTPKFVGDNIGLHPVAVIFAIMAGGHLFGFFGVLLALPVAAVAMVLLRHAVAQYKESVLYES